MMTSPTFAKWRPRRETRGKVTSRLFAAPRRVLDHYHLDICKSYAKTHKIISINRFGITCCYFSSRNIPAIALFAATFLSNLVLLRSNQCFGCGMDQSHRRKLHIQIWLWPGLLVLWMNVALRPWVGRSRVCFSFFTKIILEYFIKSMIYQILKSFKIIAYFIPRWSEDLSFDLKIQKIQVN